MYESNDTIVAISTPLGEGGIGIVRLSGPQSFKIVNEIFECKKSTRAGYPQPRYLYYGHIVDDCKERIDEVLVSFMPSPATFTKEDVVEINCHSGITLLRMILELVKKKGARLARAGEFTRRAFVNGRIDLSRAEAIINIITANSKEAVKGAARAMQGELADTVEKIREDILYARAPLEASFDYPEEFDEAIDGFDPVPGIRKIRLGLERLLEGMERNRALQHGVPVAIVGRPNVGKSSLLNVLSRQRRAIVHELPGTTRDLLESYINLGGYPLRLVDTAGIQGTDNPVEREGITRTRNVAQEAKLLIVVLDGSVPIGEEDREILSLAGKEQALVVAINKADLKQSIKRISITGISTGEIVSVSAAREKGIKLLEKAVARQLDTILGAGTESGLVVSIRHEDALRRALECLQRAEEITSIYPLEIVSQELEEARSCLGEITGATWDDKLLDKVFDQFCLGK